MAISREFRFASSIILGIIILGAVVVELLGFFHYGNSGVKPALLPLLLLPPLALIGLLVFIFSQKRKDRPFEDEELNAEDLGIIDKEPED